MAGAEILAVLLPALVGLALITLATVVMRSGDGHRHNKLFAALYFLSGLKSLSEGIRPMADSFNASAPLFPDSGAWGLAGAVCALVMTPLLLIFVSSFPRPTEWIVKHPKRGVLAFVPSVVIALLLFTAASETVAFVAAIAFSIFSTFVTAAALLLLVKARAGSPDPVERKQAGYVIVGFLPSFIATWVITTLYVLVFYGAVAPTVAQGLLDSVVGILSPIFELVAASLVGFAILKYQLLGVNPRFRLGVKSALAGGMFIALFVLTQFVENVILQGKVFSFAGDYGSFILSGATGIVLFKPIEKVSGRVSDKLLPGAAAVAAAASAGDPEAKPAEQASSAATLHAEQIYHAQCTYVLRDSQVTEREMALLRNLRTQLGLGEEQARRIEEEVERLLKVDAPQTGHTTVGPEASPEPAPNMAGGAQAQPAPPAVTRGPSDPE
jgi:hypothetical protein